MGVGTKSNHASGDHHATRRVPSGDRGLFIYLGQATLIVGHLANSNSLQNHPGEHDRTKMSDIIHVPAPADFHVHLRQGSFSELLTKHVRQGGFTLAYVMVSLLSDIVTEVLISAIDVAQLATADQNDRGGIAIQDTVASYRSLCRIFDDTVSVS